MKNYYIIETFEPDYIPCSERKNPLEIIIGTIIIGIIFTLIGGKTGLFIFLGLLGIVLAYLLRDIIKIGILIKIGMVGYDIGGWIGAIVAFVIAACVMEQMGLL